MTLAATYPVLDGREQARRVFRQGWLLMLAAFVPEVLLALFLTVLNAPEPRSGRSAGEVVALNLSSMFVLGLPVAIVATRITRRVFDRATLWLVEEREPTLAERVAVLRIPALGAFVGFGSWMFTLAVLLALNSWLFYAVGYQTLRIASGYLVCGIGAWMMGTLLAERALRPIWSVVLEGHPDRVPSALGVQWRILLSWGVGASLPLAVLAFAPQSLGLTATGWVVLIVGLVAGLLFMFLTSTSLSVPLKRLRGALSEVQSGDFHARIPIEDSGEIGQLEAGFNHMAAQLQASYENLELRVEQRTEEIRRLLRDRTEFFAGLSHELRTPLAIILTQAEMMLADTRQTARGEPEMIRAAASQLLELVNDILDLARTEAGPLDVELEPVDLRELFGDLEPMLTRLGKAASVDVGVNLPARLPEVTADPTRVREVVVNLVDNASKYTPAGGKIDISAAASNGEVRVNIADTGVGIPPEAGDRVFEPFYRVASTRPQRDQASSGLGLALTRRWLNAQGGTITWEPNPGGGTVFSFTLPLAKSEPLVNGRHGRDRAPSSAQK